MIGVLRGAAKACSWPQAEWPSILLCHRARTAPLSSADLHTLTTLSHRGIVQGSH